MSATSLTAPFLKLVTRLYFRFTKKKIILRNNMIKWLKHKQAFDPGHYIFKKLKQILSGRLRLSKKLTFLLVFVQNVRLCCYVCSHFLKSTCLITHRLVFHCSAHIKPSPQTDLPAPPAGGLAFSRPNKKCSVFPAACSGCAPGLLPGCLPSPDQTCA